MVFDIRRTTYETVQCGSRAVELQHVGMGHELLLTDGETRVDILPTGGNEPNEAAPETKDGLPVVGHYDVKDEKGTYRIYHQRHQKEHW